MTRKKSLGFTQPMTSMSYIFNDDSDRSRPIKAVPRQASANTSLRQNDSTTLIYVKSGHATICVNNEDYDLHRGVLMAIGDYQAYRIKPVQGETLEYVECQFDYLLYLFFMANPYFQFTSPGLGPCAVYSVVDDDHLETVDRLTSYLMISHEKGKHGEREVLQIMELFGFLIKYSDSENSYPIPRVEPKTSKSVEDAEPDA